MEPMLYAKGISWIDDCRIPFVDENDIPNDMDKTHLQSDRMFLEREGYKPFLYEQNTQGRFPANILVSDNMLNDGKITQGTKTKVSKEERKKDEGWGFSKKKIVEKSDKGTNSRYYDIDKWFDKLLESCE